MSLLNLIQRNFSISGKSLLVQYIEGKKGYQQRRSLGGWQGHVAPLSDLGGAPWLLISLVFGVYGMTFKGKMRK